MDVIDGGGFNVDAREVAAANDSYVLHLVEGILFALVQWFEVSMKHSIARGKEGSSDTALSELVRYSNKGGLITAHAHSHSEEQAEEKGGRLGDGRLAAIFDVVTQRMATLAADRSFGTSPLPAVQAYGKHYGKVKLQSLHSAAYVDFLVGSDSVEAAYAVQK